MALKGKNKTKQKFVWKQKKPWIAKAILVKNNQRAGGIRLPDFRPQYKDTIIKIVECWHKTQIYINGTGQKAQK